MTDLPKPVVAIPLNAALLCAECQSVFYGTPACPICLCSQFLLLEKILGTIKEKGGTDTALYTYPLSRGD